MRRLLIKLVALETALVGWLGYWLFLVYANNPSVNQGLFSQLSKFPQLSFTTVDISVLLIVGVLSLFLAFKFQKGLRPGIRLERALQMLENLMKRNLVLEAQVAELKLEKTHAGQPVSGSAVAEARPGSWERAFRTPIEAGPAVPIPPLRTATPLIRELSSERESSVQAQSRPESKIPPLTGLVAKSSPVLQERRMEQPATGLERSLERHGSSGSGSSVGQSTWEDSPKLARETKRVMTPSQSSPTGLVPGEGSLKRPYIPVPAAEAPPPSVIVGPGVSPGHTAAKLPAKPLLPLRPSQKVAAPEKSSSVSPGPTGPRPAELGALKELPSPAEAGEPDSKKVGKPAGAGRKKFPWEEG